MANKKVLKAEVGPKGTTYTFDDGSTQLVEGEFIEVGSGGVKGTLPSGLSKKNEDDEDEESALDRMRK